MAEGQLSLKIEQGATFKRQLTWSTGDPATPVDLTGYSAKLQARPQANGPLLFELTTDNGGITLSAGGVINLRLEAAVTAAMNWTSAVYDLLMIAPNGEIERLVAGTIALSHGVTK